MFAKNVLLAGAVFFQVTYIFDSQMRNCSQVQFKNRENDKYNLRLTTVNMYDRTRRAAL